MKTTAQYIGEALLAGQPTKKVGFVLKDGAITTDKVQDGAITLAKLSEDVLSSLGKVSYSTVCDTPAEEKYKFCTIDNFSLRKDVLIAVTFTQGNTASAPHLNINNTESIVMYYREEELDGNSVPSKATLLMMYDADKERWNVLSGTTESLTWL